MKTFTILLSMILCLKLQANSNAARNIVVISEQQKANGLNEAVKFLSLMQKTPRQSHGVLGDSACMSSKELKMIQTKTKRESCHEKSKLSLNSVAHSQNNGQVENKCIVNNKDLPNHLLNEEIDHQTIELLVFVSFSLGSSTLKKLHYEVSKIGGRLILRGLYKDSFRLTQQKIKELGIVVDVDPTLFERFNIKTAPTFIITEPHQNGQNYKYDQISGNITLLYALERLRAEGEVKGVDNLLAKLERPSYV